MSEPLPPGDEPATAPGVPPPPGRSGPGLYITVPGLLLVDEPDGIVISGCPPARR